MLHRYFKRNWEYLECYRKEKEISLLETFVRKMFNFGFTIFLDIFSHTHISSEKRMALQFNFSISFMV